MLLVELWTYLRSQRQDPFWAKMDTLKDEWMDKRMPGMTGRRGGKGTAASRHLSSNHQTSTAAQEEPSTGKPVNRKTRQPENLSTAPTL